MSTPLPGSRLPLVAVRAVEQMLELVPRGQSIHLGPTQATEYEFYERGGRSWTVVDVKEGLLSVKWVPPDQTRTLYEDPLVAIHYLKREAGGNIDLVAEPAGDPEWGDVVAPYRNLPLRAKPTILRLMADADQILQQTELVRARLAPEYPPPVPSNRVAVPTSQGRTYVSPFSPKERAQMRKQTGSSYTPAERQVMGIPEPLDKKARRRELLLRVFVGHGPHRPSEETYAARYRQGIADGTIAPPTPAEPETGNDIEATSESLVSGSSEVTKDEPQQRPVGYDRSGAQDRPLRLKGHSGLGEGLNGLGGGLGL